MGYFDCVCSLALNEYASNGKSRQFFLHYRKHPNIVIMNGQHVFLYWAVNMGIFVVVVGDLNTISTIFLFWHLMSWLHFSDVAT